MRIETYPASPHTFTYGRGGNGVDYIVIHFTAGTGTAKENCEYFSRGNRNSSAHLFIDGIDDGIVCKSVYINNTAWATGNWDMNQRTINIEVVSNGEDFSEVEIKKLAWIVPILMRDYGVSASRVIRHYDVVDYARVGRTIDPHKSCPAPYIDNAKWRKLHARITGGEVVENDTSAPTYSQIAVDGWIGGASVTALQKIFDCQYVDGVISGQWYGSRSRHKAFTTMRYGVGGSLVVRAMQREVGVLADGYMGTNTIKAWQRYMGVADDGWFGNDTARATQQWINRMLKKYDIVI